MQIREFRNDEFIDRVKEIEYLKNRFDTTPKEILWLYGPKSTGKTTLIEYVIEEELLKNQKIFSKYWIKYINFRGLMVGSYDSFINSFFEESEEGDDFEDEIKGGFNLGVIKLETKTLQKIKEKKKNLFNELIEKFKKLNKTKILVIDEIQTIQDIYFNGEKELLKEFLNFCVRLTKETHLAHVVILSSNTIFIDQIYNDAKLKVTSEFKKIDHLNKETIFEYLEHKGIEEKELIWDYLGGCISLIQRYIRNVEYYGGSMEYLSYAVKLARSEIVEILKREMSSKQKEIFKDIIGVILDKDFYESKEDETKEYLEVIDLMSEKEIFFYDPIEQIITENNKLYKKAFEKLVN